MAPPSLIVKLPLSATLLQRWPASKQLHAPSRVSDTFCQSTQGAPEIHISKHFSKSQLSFAFAVVKSKPHGRSTREHCQYLLNKVKGGISVPAENLPYIGSEESLRASYAKMHEEKVELEAKVHRLEEAQRKLEERFRRSERLHVWDGREIPLRVEAGASRKRPAASQEVPEDNDDDSSEIRNDRNLKLNRYVLQIIHQQDSLEKAAKQSNLYLTLDQINHLAQCIIQTMKLLENSISDCCLPLKLLKTNDDDLKALFLLRQLLHQIKRSFCACFIAMTQLDHTIPGRARQREIVAIMIFFFQTSLNFLQTVSALQSEDPQIQRNVNAESKRARLESEEYVVNKYLAQTLASIVKELDWKVDQNGHDEILEGILFLVIQHIGRLISEAVFGEHVAASNSPGNITNNPNLPPRGVLRPESRYMVRILYAALGDTKRKELVSQVLSEGRNSRSLFPRDSPVERVRSSASRALLEKVQKRLQATLLPSILGGFDQEHLRIPEPPKEMGDVEDISIEGERYGKEWLLNTVWGLIGWDMVTPDFSIR